MLSFNFNVKPDEYATLTHPDGGYNFTCITEEENDAILSMLKTAQSYPESQRGISLAFNSESVIYKPRYIINQIIVEYSENSVFPLDKLAKFIGYFRKSSQFRPDAIKAFESYIPNYSQANIPLAPSGNPMYSLSWLYLTVAELYEKEGLFEKALNAIDMSRKEGWTAVVCAQRHAEILAKIDINQAVDYLNNAIAVSSEFSQVLSPMLQDYQAKAAKGYKFKSRKKSSINDNDNEQQIKQLAYRYLIET